MLVYIVAEWQGKLLTLGNATLAKTHFVAAVNPFGPTIK